jgi:hypothetical protein
MRVGFHSLPGRNLPALRGGISRPRRPLAAVPVNSQPPIPGSNAATKLISAFFTLGITAALSGAQSVAAEKAPARPVNRPPEYSNFDGEGFPAMRPVWGVKPKLSLKVRSR